MISDSGIKDGLIYEQRQKFTFEERTSIVGNDKENCLELNNLPLSLRETHLVSNVMNKQNRFNMISLTSTHNRRKRPDGCKADKGNSKIGNQSKDWNIKDYLLSSNQPNSQSPYLMFTPLSLVGEYDSATINPFFHYCQQSEPNYCPTPQGQINHKQQQNFTQNNKTKQFGTKQHANNELKQSSKSQFKQQIQRNIPQQKPTFNYYNHNQNDEVNTQKNINNSSISPQKPIASGIKDKNSSFKSPSNESVQQNTSNQHKSELLSEKYNSNRQFIIQNSFSSKKKQAMQAEQNEGQYLELSHIQLQKLNGQKLTALAQQQIIQIRGTSIKNESNNLTKIKHETNDLKPDLMNRNQRTYSAIKNELAVTYKNMTQQNNDQQPRDEQVLNQFNLINEHLEETVFLYKQTNTSQNIYITIGDIVTYVNTTIQLNNPNQPSIRPTQQHRSKLANKEAIYQINLRSSITPQVEIPRKSISLFSRMMKPQQQLCRNSNSLKAKQKAIQSQSLYLLLQKQHAIRSFIHILDEQMQQSQPNNNAPPSKSYSIEQLVKQKYECNTQKIRQSWMKHGNQLDVIASCELQGQSERDQQNQQQDEDQEWSSKYITSRRHQTSRTLPRSKQLIRGYTQLQITVDELQQLLKRLNAFWFLISELIDQYAFIAKANLQIQAQSTQVIKQTIGYLVDRFTLNESSQHNRFKSAKDNQGFLTHQTTQHFHYLLYNLWLQTYRSQNLNKRNGLFQESTLDRQSVFSSVFQLLPSHQYFILFTLYLIKQLQKSFKHKPAIQYSSFKSSQEIAKKPANQKYNQKGNNLKQINSSQKQLTQQLKTIRNPAKSFLTQRIHNRKTISKQQVSLKQSIDKKEPEEIQINIKHIAKNSLTSSRPNLSTKNSAIQYQNLIAKINKKKLLRLNVKQIKGKNQNNQFKEETIKCNKNDQKLQRNQRVLTQTCYREETGLKKYTDCSRSSNKLRLIPRDKQLIKNSRDPNLHKQYIKGLKLEQNMREHERQLQRKESIIKRLLLMQQLQQIEHEIQIKNQQVIRNNQIESIKFTYRDRINDQQDHINDLKDQLTCQGRTLTSIQTQRRLQARLLQQGNHLHMVKKLPLSSASQHLFRKTHYR